MDTESKYIKIVLRLISKLCPSKKKTTYSNEYYLEKCINVLRDTTSWAACGEDYFLEKSITIKRFKTNSFNGVS